MALFSFFKRKTSPPPVSTSGPPPGDEAGPVQVARARARRRLIGAVVLLAVGVIGFPMLFETQPRPLPANIPIELPRREGAAAFPPAGPRHAPTLTELPPAVDGAAADSGASDAGTSRVAVAASAGPASRPSAIETAERAKPESARPAALPRQPEATQTDSKPTEPKPPESKKPDAGKDEPRKDSERARAALEGRPSSAAASTAPVDAKAGRFVVQVGAYTDASTLREVRAKVEKLGLKTYTQSVETDAGIRTRVRVGPFTTRQEAESAGAKLKGAGLPGNVLTL
jgi:DedD protein